MSKNRRLKSFVRYDGTGRVVPSSVILAYSKPKVGNWKEINAYECCNTTPTVDVYFRLTFETFEDANLLVGDASNVEDWNTFLNLPTNGNPYTSVEISGNVITLRGGSNVIIQEFAFEEVDTLIRLEDTGTVIEILSGAFYYTYNLEYARFDACLYIRFDSGAGYGAFEDSALTEAYFPSVLLIDDSSFYSAELTVIVAPNVEELGPQNLYSVFNGCDFTSVNFPNVTTIGDGCFRLCSSLETINIPSCQNLGSTTGDNSVFEFISGNNITLTIPTALLTVDAGNPDGDIVYLDANNTVTTV